MVGGLGGVYGRNQHYERMRSRKRIDERDRFSFDSANKRRKRRRRRRRRRRRGWGYSDICTHVWAARGSLIRESGRTPGTTITAGAPVGFLFFSFPFPLFFFFFIRR